ncbi:hypothetical protein BARVI_02425 [Barnesiella viscericola DSM 18177]|uniref:Uncharacterized protein n=1 Tax=Barnesiella viscericola DSM 18177 TaxID=880074 RepID=W0ES13_9BACT|nr:hypothetical protein BARVI_02425 [Barnesiella viscericola DSM 18177]
MEAAKTEVIVALMAKVGSLFGNGKLKELEFRNEDLQNRIQEFEVVTLLQEEQYTRQI